MQESSTMETSQTIEAFSNNFNFENDEIFRQEVQVVKKKLIQQKYLHHLLNQLGRDLERFNVEFLHELCKRKGVMEGRPGEGRLYDDYDEGLDTANLVAKLKDYALEHGGSFVNDAELKSFKRVRDNV